MNKKQITLIATFIIALLIPFTARAAGFSDTKGHWAEGAIEYCAEKGYIHGYPDGSFKPDAPITKVEYYTITNFLNKEKLRDTTSTPVPFTDVQESDWAFQEVQKGLSLGYIEKNGEELQPNIPITREDAVRIFSLNKGWASNEAALSKFSDREEITERYRGLVGAAVENKVLSGYPNGTFGPKDPLTRGQVVTIIAMSEGFKPEAGDKAILGYWFLPQKIKFESTETRELINFLIISMGEDGRYIIEEHFMFEDKTGFATLSYGSYDPASKILSKDKSTFGQDTAGVFQGNSPASGERKFKLENDTLVDQEQGITYVRPQEQ